MDVTSWTVEQWCALGGLVLSAFPANKYIVQPIRLGISKVALAIDRVEEVSKLLGKNGGESLGDMIRSTDSRTQLGWSRMDYLCDQLDRPVFECAPDGSNVRINSAFTNHFGYSPAEMLAQKWVRMIHIDDRDRVMTEWAHAISDGRIFECIYRCTTRGGVIVRVRAIAEPCFHITTGKLIRWMGRIETIAPAQGNQP